MPGVFDDSTHPFSTTGISVLNNYPVARDDPSPGVGHHSGRAYGIEESEAVG